MSGYRQSAVTGAILCGGKSSRLGTDKAQLELGGKSLLHHAITRLEPQVDGVVLSVQAGSQELASGRHTRVPDILASHRGPLMGLYSALKSIENGDHQWLALCPCDAPFLPLNLVVRLMDAAQRSNKAVSVARYAGVVQPTFSLWHRDVTGAIGAVVLEQGKGGLMTMLDQLAHEVVDWAASEPPPFFNINAPEDLGLARRLLDAGAAGD